MDWGRGLGWGGGYVWMYVRWLFSLFWYVSMYVYMCGRLGSRLGSRRAGKSFLSYRGLIYNTYIYISLSVCLSVRGEFILSRWM